MFEPEKKEKKRKKHHRSGGYCQMSPILMKCASAKLNLTIWKKKKCSCV